MKRNSPWFLEGVRMAREEIAAQKEAKRQEKARERLVLAMIMRAAIRQQKESQS